jgi:Tfp pilus assembly protein FimV
LDMGAGESANTILREVVSEGLKQVTKEDRNAS